MTKTGNLPITCFDCGERLNTNGRVYILDTSNPGFSLCQSCVRKRIKDDKLNLDVEKELRGKK